jgi:predicted alpha/beta superfamily hydrolase
MNITVMKYILISLFLLCPQFVFASDLVLAKQISIYSKVFNQQRNLLIKTPENYDQENSTYPVLYVLHGQWDMLSVISTLELLVNELPNFIVVGIESKGMELRPDGGKPTKFSKYLIQEVVSYLDKNFSLAPFSILSGHSNSGRFVLDFWLNNNNQFSQYFSFSPSLDDGYIVERVSKLSSDLLFVKDPLIITIADEGEHMQKPFNALIKQLKPELNDSFSYRKFPEQSHQTTKHSSIQFALKTTFKDWVPSRETKVGGLDGLTAHYQNLSKKFGFKVEVPIDTLQQLTGYYAISEQSDASKNLDKIIRFALRQSIANSEALFEIVDYFNSNESLSAGNSVLKAICRHASELKRCKV